MHKVNGALFGTLKPIPKARQRGGVRFIALRGANVVNYLAGRLSERGVVYTTGVNCGNTYQSAQDRACARRLRQIEAGRLTASNGLCGEERL